VFHCRRKNAQVDKEKTSGLSRLDNHNGVSFVAGSGIVVLVVLYCNRIRVSLAALYARYTFNTLGNEPDRDIPPSNNGIPFVDEVGNAESIVVDPDDVVVLVDHDRVEPFGLGGTIATDSDIVKRAKRPTLDVDVDVAFERIHPRRTDSLHFTSIPVRCRKYQDLSKFRPGTSQIRKHKWRMIYELIFFCNNSNRRKQKWKQNTLS
jgi:hypothetical protein